MSICFHRSVGKRVDYTGSVFQRENEFFFSSGSVLNGHSGRVTLYVKDEKNKLNNDSIAIELANGMFINNYPDGFYGKTNRKSFGEFFSLTYFRPVLHFI